MNAEKNERPALPCQMADVPGDDPPEPLPQETELDEERRARLARPWPGSLPPIVSTPGPWCVNLFDGRPRVSHHQIHFEPMEVAHGDGMLPAPSENFNGQRNGLCGTALPDRMCLMTGRHTGEVSLRIDLFSEAPPLDAGWEDIVEASFQVVHGRVLLAPLLSDQSWPLDLPLGCYRVRCLASGRRDEMVRTPGDPAERILMQWWREPGPRADEILKVGSDSARAAHDGLGGRGA